MNTSSRPIFLGLVALNLAVVACSSTSLKKAGDAATTPDLGMADRAARDGGSDLAGPDLAGPDVAGPELASGDVPSPDTLVGKDAPIAADLSASKDLPSLADVPANQDTIILADLSGTTVDAPTIDASATDVPMPADLAPRDGAADRPAVCKPDALGPVPCNDDPNSQAVMGTCQADGTCACNSYFVFNPSTGRCMYPPRDASVASDTVAAGTCTGDYTACGCGCCGGVQATSSCYYPSLGETIAAITAQDQADKSATNCSLVGCSLGIHYVCCAEGTPESPSSATYVADGYSGGLDHVTISKSGSDCATVSFANPMSSTNSLLEITTPSSPTSPSSWGVVSGGFGACGDAGATDQAKGAVGTLALRASGSQCLADLHATLFAFAADGTVTSARLDVDGVVVTGLDGSMCK
jgi:hypothetical protein